MTQPNNLAKDDAGEYKRMRERLAIMIDDLRRLSLITPVFSNNLTDVPVAGISCRTVIEGLSLTLEDKDYRDCDASNEWSDRNPRATVQPLDTTPNVGEPIERTHAGCGGRFRIYNSCVRCETCGTPYSAATVNALVTVQAYRIPRNLLDEMLTRVWGFHDDPDLLDDVCAALREKGVEIA